MAEIYHRIATGKKNQDLQVAFQQAQSAQVWGSVSTFGNLYPTVRAYVGHLPPGKDGVEFETDVPPTPGCSTPAEVYWKPVPDSPQVLSMQGGAFAAIPVRLRRVRYQQNINLAGGVDWP